MFDTVSAWADTRRWMHHDSAVSGPWRTSACEYTRWMMDAAVSGAERVILMGAAQTGKTSAIENIIGFMLETERFHVSALQSRGYAARDWEDRLGPMLTRALGGKSYGSLSVYAATKVAEHHLRPNRVVVGDDVDKFPVGGLRDPLRLVEDRTLVFEHPLIVLAGAPTTSEGRIAREYAASDRSEFHVACPYCASVAPMRFAHVRWRCADGSDAAYACPDCGSLWSEADRHEAIAAGKWEAAVDTGGKVVGLRTSKLHCPLTRLARVARAFIETAGDPELRAMWLQVYLGLPSDTAISEA